MTTPDRLLAAVLRQDFTSFVRKVFATVSPGERYVENWYVEAIAHELEELLAGKTARLLITQPPRTLKSICTSVAFVAWALGHNPALFFICASYSQELSSDLARKFRLVITSDWYRSLFPQFGLHRDTDGEIITSMRGGRLATSVGGSITGRGAHIIVIDDPHKAEEAQSEVARARVKTWYTETLLSRFNDQSTGRLILVMQRLHEEDLAGHIAKDCRHLDLPAKATERQQLPLGRGRVKVREPGDLLDPIRLGKLELDRLQSEIGSLGFSAQYQQRPTPLEGNLIKREWLRFYRDLPNPEYRRIVQSWDVAVSNDGDYSVCTTWLIVGKDAYLTDLWRGRLEFPDLLKKAIAHAQAFQAPTILVEKAGLGMSLYQALRQQPRVGSVLPFDPKGTKIERLEGESPAIEAGHIHFPENAPWLADLLHELLGFPTTKYDDQVDSISQFLAWRRTHAATPNAPSTMLFGKLIEGDPRPY